MLLVGYFEGLSSQRGIAWRCANSLSLDQGSPDHSTLSNTRRRLSPPEAAGSLVGYGQRAVSRMPPSWSPGYPKTLRVYYPQ